MSVAGWNLWKFTFFRQARSAFSSEQRLIQACMLSETNVGSLLKLYLDIGFCISEPQKKAWQVVQKLMMPMEGVIELVLPISERSHLPLDPLNRLTEDEKKALGNLDDLAEDAMTRAESQLADENKKGANARLMTTIFWLIGIVAIIALLILLLHGGKK